jgi:hypothetical protein
MSSTTEGNEDSREPAGTRVVVCLDCGSITDEETWNEEPAGCANCGEPVGQVYVATDEIVDVSED